MTHLIDNVIKHVEKLCIIVTNDSNFQLFHIEIQSKDNENLISLNYPSFPYIAFFFNLKYETFKKIFPFNQ